MPCETIRRPGETLAERRKRILDALKRLDAQLAKGSVTVTVGPQGGVAFVGWADRDDMTDVCAFRSLSLLKSRSLQQAITLAEIRSGAKVNPQAVAAGWHSHDGGKTWGRHLCPGASLGSPVVVPAPRISTTAPSAPRHRAASASIHVGSATSPFHAATPGSACDARKLCFGGSTTMTQA